MKELNLQLNHWIDHGKAGPLQDFLRGLSKKERRSLAPEIIRIQEAYSNRTLIRLTTSNNYKSLLAIAAFVCLSKTEKRSFVIHWLDFLFAYEEGLFNWCKVSWLESYLSEEPIGFSDGERLDYAMLMQLKAEGIWEPNPEKIGIALLHSVFSYSHLKYYRRIYHYVPQYLEHYPETLGTHIWYCFEQGLSFADMEKVVLDGLPETVDAPTWRFTLGRLVGAGKLDRARLLAASLNACTLQRPTPDLNWYGDMFDYLEPQIPELLALQEALFGVFYSEAIRPISIVIKYIKKIASHHKFAVEAFAEQVGILLSHPKKNIVRSAQIIVQKIAKTNALLHQDLCQLMLPVFMRPEIELQLRAAKFIVAFSTPEDDNLSIELAQFAPYLSGEAKDLLQDYLSVEHEELGDQTWELPPILVAENEIAYPQSFEDFVFVLATAWDDRSLENFERVLYGCHRYGGDLNREQIDQLEPICIRLYKQLESLVGLDELLGYFVASWTMHLIAINPIATQNIKRHYKTHISQLYLPKRAYELSIWPRIKEMLAVPILKVFVQRCERILQSLRDGQYLPLLAIPTHQPHWIDPEVLVDRVEAYQQADAEMPAIELQIALCRTVLPAPALLLASLGSRLDKERLRLISYFLDPQASAPLEFNHPETLEIAAFNKWGGLQDTAAFAQSDFVLPTARWTGDFKWEVEHQQMQMHRLVIHNDLEPIRRDTNLLKEAWDWLAPSLSIDPSFHLYREIKVPLGEWWGQWNPAVSVADAPKLLSLIPRYPDVLFAELVLQCFPHYSYSNKAAIKGLLIALNLHRHPFGRMAHLSMGLVLLCRQRTERAQAAELMLWGLDLKLIDVAQLGFVLGQLLSVGFGPVKRLTDAFMPCFAELRQRHPEAIYICFTEMLSLMPLKAARNQKPLLELYWELIQAKKPEKLEKRVAQRLSHWKAGTGSQRLIKKIEAYFTD